MIIWSDETPCLRDHRPRRCTHVCWKGHRQDFAASDAFARFLVNGRQQRPPIRRRSLERLAGRTRPFSPDPLMHPVRGAGKLANPRARLRATWRQPINTSRKMRRFSGVVHRTRENDPHFKPRFVHFGTPPRPLAPNRLPAAAKPRRSSAHAMRLLRKPPIVRVTFKDEPATAATPAGRACAARAIIDNTAGRKIPVTSCPPALDRSRARWRGCVFVPSTW
jgi:hypothetical protein